MQVRFIQQIKDETIINLVLIGLHFNADNFVLCHKTMNFKLQK